MKQFDEMLALMEKRDDPAVEFLVDKEIMRSCPTLGSKYLSTGCQG